MPSHLTDYLVRAAFWPLIVFEAANMVGLLHASREPIWLGLLATSVGAYGAYEAWHWYRRRIGATHIPPLSICTGIVVVYADAVGNIFDWYNAVESYDKLIHFLSGIAATAISFFLLSRVVAAKGWQVPWGAVGYTALLTGLLLGVGFELVEYLADTYYGTNFWLGSGVDTLTDVLLDLAGGGVALMGLAILQRDRS